MLPHTSSVQPSSTRVGVGIDTSRYGHYAVFLRDDLQPAAADLSFAESAGGYGQLNQRLEAIAQRQGQVTFIVRVDAAGQYADNLLHFLHGLGNRRPDAAPLALSVSCGDPQRNKNYCAAIFGKKKSDPIEAQACARFALTERPAADTPMSPDLRALRQVAARLQAVVRHRTRLVNQLHHLLNHAFPELALHLKDISAGWVLELVHRYPTALLLAQANETALGSIPYLPDEQIQPLLQYARSSVASLCGDSSAELVRDQVRQLRDANARQKRLENLLVSTYQSLPDANHLATIPGFGDVTAAILTAVIADIERFHNPGQLVKYFGTMPIEVASGVDRDGQPRGPKRSVMSKRGNDLVRRYLWMAALSAIRSNPAVRALYRRVVAKHPDRRAVAVGHAMRKLLHLAFAIWKTKKPFDPDHYPWHHPAHLDRQAEAETSDIPMSLEATKENRAAGHTLTAKPAQKVVTATRKDPAPTQAVDFAHLKQQLPLARVLDQLGLTPKLRGPGPQKRCTCPIHRGDGRGRTFSVHLADNVFQCFDKACAKKGDVIDLWASVNGMSLRQAALDLVQTFHLEPAPQGTGKRNG